MTTLVSDLIGLTEIADLYQVSKNTANGWTKRPDFPAPKHRLAMGPMWDKGEVAQWLKPNNFPQELLIHCAWCQSQKLRRPEVTDASKTYDHTLLTETAGMIKLRYTCDTCNNRTLLFIARTRDDRPILSTMKEITQ